MSDTVHILATCLNTDLIGATTLVFRTVRIGFPSAKIYVWSNNLPHKVLPEVYQACASTSAIFSKLDSQVLHDQWVDTLITKGHTPFWICDTDMVLWNSVEGWFENETIAGRYEPAFVEPWTKTHRAERLHTCLMWINPIAVRSKIREWISQWHPKGFPFLPQSTFIRQQFIPQGAGKPPLFYDTCTGLYKAIGGTRFTDEQNACFEHLHCGTYSDRIASALPEMREVHQSVINNYSAAKGLHLAQEAFYAENSL